MNHKKLLFSSLALSLAAAMTSHPVVAEPKTPIQHLVVVVGENVAFDTLYGGYKPVNGQSINNLLSQGIINADGTPGRHFAKAMQRVGENKGGEYTAKPLIKKPYQSLPQPLRTGILNPNTLQFDSPTADTRFPNNLSNGPFQITRYVPYGSPDSATGDPVHRFFQMWQQTGGDNSKLSLFLWVAHTTGTGGENGADSPTPEATHQGGELMGFFNMSQGDAPYFKQLADSYALSDNFHQSIMGGTGANFFSIATADVAVYNQNGQFATPPANQIENPSPRSGTENFYSHDGYSGGSYVNCADAAQPGVASILKILKTNKRASNCEKEAFYLVNNYELPYTVDGTARELGADKFVYPPQSRPTIGEALSSKEVSWRWYSAGRDSADILNDGYYQMVRAYVNSQVPTDIPEPVRTQVVDGKTYETMLTLVYNTAGDPLNASVNFAQSPQLRSHLKGLTTFYNDVANETLPAVSFVVPKNLDSGHPGYSAPVSYELFIKELLTAVQSKPALWANTAVIITTDEGGGYFDSGLIQNLDFFGDGPRIPFLVVSPYAKKGYVDHVYHSHASILKFIEYNWGLNPLSNRSRDNLPNPVKGKNPYLPKNQPAIGDLTSLFSFQ